MDARGTRFSGKLSISLSVGAPSRRVLPIGLKSKGQYVRITHITDSVEVPSIRVFPIRLQGRVHVRVHTISNSVGTTRSRELLPMTTAEALQYLEIIGKCSTVTTCQPSCLANSVPAGTKARSTSCRRPQQKDFVNVQHDSAISALKMKLFCLQNHYNF